MDLYGMVLNLAMTVLSDDEPDDCELAESLIDHMCLVLNDNRSGLFPIMTDQDADWLKGLINSATKLCWMQGLRAKLDALCSSF